MTKRTLWNCKNRCEAGVAATIVSAVKPTIHEVPAIIIFITTGLGRMDATQPKRDYTAFATFGNPLAIEDKLVEQPDILRLDVDDAVLSVDEVALRVAD